MVYILVVLRAFLGHVYSTFGIRVSIGRVLRKKNSVTIGGFQKWISIETNE